MAKTPPKSKPSAREESLLAGLEPPPSLVSTTDRRAPFGLPEATITEQFPGFKPFIQGDEYAPRTLSPADRVRIQRIMVRVGILGENDYSPGVWDPRSAGAYQDVLSLANSMGSRDIEAVLGEYESQAKTYGTKPKKPRQPLVVSYANPESVRQVIRESSFRMLGKRLGDAEEGALVSAYQNQYLASQRAQYGAGGEGGGSYTEPMTAAAFAETELGRRPEATSQRYLQGFEKALEVLTGTVTPAPRGLSSS